MTDYLELLLELQEEEESGQSTTWKRPGRLAATNRDARTEERLFEGTALEAQSEEKKNLVKEAFEESGRTNSLSELASVRAGVEQLRRSWDAVRMKQVAEDYRVETLEGKTIRQTQSVQEKEPAEQELTTQLVWLHRAVQRANSRPEQRRTPETKATAERNHPLWKKEHSIGGAINYAALVDAAFSRDARRYDGPLGLL